MSYQEQTALNNAVRAVAQVVKLKSVPRPGVPAPTPNVTSPTLTPTTNTNK